MNWQRFYLSKCENRKPRTNSYKIKRIGKSLTYKGLTNFIFRWAYFNGHPVPCMYYTLSYRKMIYINFQRSLRFWFYYCLSLLQQATLQLFLAVFRENAQKGKCTPVRLKICTFRGANDYVSFTVQSTVILFRYTIGPTEKNAFLTIF